MTSTIKIIRLIYDQHFFIYNFLFLIYSFINFYFIWLTKFDLLCFIHNLFYFPSNWVFISRFINAVCLISFDSFSRTVFITKIFEEFEDISVLNMENVFALYESKTVQDHAALKRVLKKRDLLRDNHWNMLRSSSSTLGWKVALSGQQPAANGQALWTETIRSIAKYRYSTEILPDMKYFAPNIIPFSGTQVKNFNLPYRMKNKRCHLSNFVFERFITYCFVTLKGFEGINDKINSNNQL